MKRKFLQLLICLIALCLLLVSCQVGEDGDGNGSGSGGTGDSSGGTDSGSGNPSDSDGSDTVTGDYIFKPGSTLNIVTPATGDAVNALARELRELGITVNTVGPSVAKAEHEIIIGQSSREGSVAAYRRLSRIELSDDIHVGYVIYSTGTSLCIAYHEDRFDLEAAKITAIEYIRENLLTRSTLALGKGTVCSEETSPIEYQAKLDEIDYAKKWATFEEKLSEHTENSAEIVEAVKNYYEWVCTPDTLSWFANLYDPAIGGFYYSNSARDNEGYLPDAESTSQALGVWEKFGVPNPYSQIPEWMRQQIIAFLKGLQDPKTGYFYHPQWSKEEVDAHLSRRARDLSKSVSSLRVLGSAPTYDTPDGDKGDGLLADGTPVGGGDTSAVCARLTSRLGTSAYGAASRVVATASSVAVPSHLIDDVAFKSYLAECEAANAIPVGQTGHRSFYAIGNEIGSQISQIKKRDADLKSAGAKYSLEEILYEWYTEHQNKKTGLWDEGINYDATNALLKICGTYTELGKVFPNADLAIRSCIEMLTSPDAVEATVYVYNIWMSLYNIFKNLSSEFATGDPKNAELIKSSREELLEHAPLTIEISARKQLTFKKADGSFSYLPNETATTSQGMRVAVPRTNEGDINATTIAMGGTINNCLGALGLSGYAPSYFSRADMYYYIYLLEGLGPVIKDESEMVIDYLTFDDDTVGNTPTGTVLTKDDSKGGLGSLTVEEDIYGDISGNLAASFTTVPGAGDTLRLNSQSGSLTASCFVFEADINMVESDEAYVMQLLLQPQTYMLGLKVSDGRVGLLESSSATWKTAKEVDLGVSAALGEWFNIRVEYYVGDHNSVRIMVYFNRELIAITDNYYDSTGAKLSGVGTPSSSFDYVSIIGMKDYSFTVLLDNLAAYKTSDSYKLPPVDSLPHINVDPPERGELVHTFDSLSSLEIHQNNSLLAPSIATNPATGSNSLKLVGTGTDKVTNEEGKDVDPTPASVFIPINVRGPGAKTIVLETDVKIVTDKTTTALRIYFRENNTARNDLVCFDLTVEKATDGCFVRINDAPNGGQAASFDGIRVPIEEAFRLRLEYYEEELTTLIYINGKLLGASGTICSYADKYSAGLLEITGLTKQSGFETYLDNLIFERTTRSFKAATAPPLPEVNHDFSKSDTGVTLSGGAKLEREMAKLAKEGASLSVNSEARSEVYTATSFKSQIKLGAGTLGTYRFTLLSESDEEITSFELERSKKALTLREYYAGGVGSDMLRAELASGEGELSFNYYHDRKITAIYLDGVLIGINTLTYSYDRESLLPTKLKIEQVSGSGTVYFDNVVLEKSLIVYKKATISGLIVPDKNDWDFENSYRDMLPGGVVTDVSSTGGQFDVKGVEIGKDESGNPIYSKFVTMTTTIGGNDYIEFNMQESSKLTGKAVTVFEADILLDGAPSCDSTTVELYLKDASGNSAWRLLLQFNDAESTGKNKGKLHISDWMNSKGTIGAEYADEGRLIKLRLEYAEADDGSIFVNLFIDGKYVATSTNPYSLTNVYAPESITKARFYATSAAVGTILFDNVKLYHTTELSSTETEDDGGDTGDGGNTEGGGDTGEGGNTGEGGSTGEPVLPEGDGSFDNIGVIPEKPDDAPVYDGSGWTKPE